jgi:predicted ATPase
MADHLLTELASESPFDQMQKFGAFQLDSANECLWHGDQRLKLTPRPFALLRYLIEHPNRLVTHDELLEELWPETYVQPQVLRTYVLEIRKLLGDSPACPQFIETVPKRGYRFLVPVNFENQADGHGPYCIGREAELEHLRDAFDRAGKGERPAVFLTGEAGIGKTALIDAFCGRVREEHARVRIARGQSSDGLGGQEPFYSIREAIRGLCSTQDSGARALLSGALPGWFAQNGAGRPSLSEICEALEKMSEGETVLLVLEDVQRADASTLDLISALTRRRARAKIMLMASFRSADVGSQHSLRKLQYDLVTSRKWEELCLGPLDRSAVCEYLRNKLRANYLPEGLISLVHQHSGGNPLYMSAVLDDLRAKQMVRNESGKAVLTRALEEIESEVNDGLAGVVELELDRLVEKDRRLLEAGSVAGAIFPAWAPAAALNRRVEEIEEAYAALARRVRLIVVAGHDELPDGSSCSFFVFTHALHREALYRSIPAYRRSQWHKRIAERLRFLFTGKESTVAHEIAVHTRASEFQS